MMMMNNLPPEEMGSTIQSGKKIPGKQFVIVEDDDNPFQTELDMEAMEGQNLTEDETGGPIRHDRFPTVERERTLPAIDYSDTSCLGCVKRWGRCLWQWLLEGKFVIQMLFISVVSTTAQTLYIFMNGADIFEGLLAGVGTGFAGLVVLFGLEYANKYYAERQHDDGSGYVLRDDLHILTICNWFVGVGLLSLSIVAVALMYNLCPHEVGVKCDVTGIVWSSISRYNTTN